MNPAIRPLLQAFPIGQTASSNPLFDIVNVQEPGSIDEYSENFRFDYIINSKNKMYVRYNRDDGYGLATANSTGSSINYYAVPQNAVVALTQTFTQTLLNEIKVGLNAPKTRVYANAPTVPGVDLSGVTVSLSGVVSLGGTGGQQGSVGIASPTGQLKLSSALNGRAAPFTNYSLSFIDNMTWIHGSHIVKFGVEVRPEHLKTAFYGGTTYSFANIQAFLADAPSQVAFNGDTTALSPFTGKSGFSVMHQTFYIGYVQDEWKIKPNFTMNYGLRYEYYSPLKESNDKVVWFDVPTGTLIPNYTGDWYTMKTMNFGPRLGFSWSPEVFKNKTVIRVGGGYYYGPGLTEGQTQPATNDRINRTITSGPLLTYPVTPADLPFQLQHQRSQPAVPAPCLSSGLQDSGTDFAVLRFDRATTAGQHGTDGGLCGQPGTKPVLARHHQQDHRRGHESHHWGGIGGARVQRGQRNHGNEPVRGNRYQDQRRIR